MKTLIAGVDCSTQSTKVVVVDSESGAAPRRAKRHATVMRRAVARATHSFRPAGQLVALNRRSLR